MLNPKTVAGSYPTDPPGLCPDPVLPCFHKLPVARQLQDRQCHLYSYEWLQLPVMAGIGYMPRHPGLELCECHGAIQYNLNLSQVTTYAG